MKRKVFFLLVLIILSFYNNVYAKVMNCTEEDFATGRHGCKNKYETLLGGAGVMQTLSCTEGDYATHDHDCKDTYDVDISSTADWWKTAGNFFNGAAPTSTRALDGLNNLIKAVGNMLFVLVTVVLGVKYIWGGVEAKSSVKDSLITLVVAALFFYGYTTISNLFMSGNNLVFINTGSYETTAKAIYSTVLYICNFLAVGGLVYIGVKYMMAGAEGKASLKARGVPIVLGLIMVYATITFLNFIVGIL